MACIISAVFILAVIIFVIVTEPLDRSAVHPVHADCPRCGHGLADAEFDAPCPACALPAARRVQTRCPTCKYDLSGTLDAAHCPECGMDHPVLHIKHTRRALFLSPIVLRGIGALLVTPAVAYITYFFALGLAAVAWELVPQLLQRPESFAVPISVILRGHAPNASALGLAALSGVAMFMLMLPNRPSAWLLPTILVGWVGFAIGVIVALLDRFHNHALAGTWMGLFTFTPMTIHLVIRLARGHHRRSARSLVVGPPTTP